MTFIDPDTGIVIDCSVWEYELLRSKYIKKNVHYGVGD